MRNEPFNAFPTFLPVCFHFRQVVVVVFVQFSVMNCQNANASKLQFYLEMWMCVMWAPNNEAKYENNFEAITEMSLPRYNNTTTVCLKLALLPACFCQCNFTFVSRNHYNGSPSRTNWIAEENLWEWKIVCRFLTGPWKSIRKIKLERSTSYRPVFKR